MYLFRIRPSAFAEKTGIPGVKISFINSPSDFWVQFPWNGLYLSKLENQLSGANRWDTASEEELNIGKKRISDFILHATCFTDSSN